MKRVLITGANSFVGTNIEKWLMKAPENFQVETVDTMNGAWRMGDFSIYDVVFHVAGIAHVDPKPEMAPLYYIMCGPVFGSHIAFVGRFWRVKKFLA